MKLRNKWFDTEVEGELVHDWPESYILKLKGENYNTRYYKKFWEEIE